jgi:hypothetical protein
MKTALLISIFLISEILLRTLFNKYMRRYFEFNIDSNSDVNFFGLEISEVRGPFERFVVYFTLFFSLRNLLLVVYAFRIIMGLSDKKLAPKSNFLIGKTISLFLGLLYYYVFTVLSNQL